MDTPNTLDNLIKDGRYPTYVELDTPWELAWKVQALYKGIKPIIDLVQTVEKGAQVNKIEHIFLGEDELDIVGDKAVKITNDLRFFVNTFTKYQNDEQVIAKINELKPKKVTDLEDHDDWATKQYIQDAIDALIDGAPEALDTLKEIADLLEDDTDGVAAIINRLNTLSKRMDDAPFYYNVYIGMGESVEDIMITENHYDSIRRTTPMNIMGNKSLFVIIPSKYSTPTVLMSGVLIPMVNEPSVIRDGVVFKVLKSVNTYSESFNVILL